MINKITADDVRQMIGSEGLVLQGCGGDPAEWLQGINEMLTEDGILLNGTAFKDISVFEHNGLTNILFPFGSMDSDTLHIGKLAIWRLKTHSAFGGTWLSDYLPNSLGVDITAAKESSRPSTAINNRVSLSTHVKPGDEGNVYRYFERLYAKSSDALGVQEIMAMTGLSDKTVLQLLKAGNIKSIAAHPRYIVPKTFLLEFLTSRRYIDLFSNSEGFLRIVEGFKTHIQP